MKKKWKLIDPISIKNKRPILIIVYFKACTSTKKAPNICVSDK